MCSKWWVALPKHEVHHIDGSSTLVVLQVSSAEQPAVDPPTSTTPLYEPPGSAERPPPGSAERPPTPTATPLYDLFKAKLDDEECILFEAHAQKCFFSKLLPTGVSVADKVEILLQTCLKRRNMYLAKSGRPSSDRLDKDAMADCMSTWSHDVRSWMRQATLQKYMAASGKQKIAKRAFSTSVRTL